MSEYRERFKNCQYRNEEVDFPNDVSQLPIVPPVGFDPKAFMENAKGCRCTSPNRFSDICSSNCPELKYDSLGSFDFIVAQIQYLERKRNVTFIDGLRNYFNLCGEAKEEYAMYYILYQELNKRIEEVENE